MNLRERILAMAVLSVVILVGVFFLLRQFVLAGLDERDNNIAALKMAIGNKQRDLATKQNWIQQKLKEKPRLASWRQLSLPVNAELSKRDHQKYLSELMRRYENHLSEMMDESGFTPGARITARVTDTKGKAAPAGKAPPYTPVTVIIEDAHADLAGLVKMLERFYRTSLLHQIKNISIQRPLTARPQQKPGELDIKLTVEALIVTGAEDRAQLMPEVDRRLVALDALATWRGGPGSLALVPWAAGPTGPLGPRVLAEPQRQYASIAAKNIFFGRAPAAERVTGNEFDSLQNVYLTTITRNDRRTEAFLYVRFSNRRVRLRASAGFDTFRIQDGQGETLLHGKVIRIDDRDVLFKVDDAYYSIHVGQSLKEAMERPLKEGTIKELEKTP
jgi:hypothetical protein